MVHDLVARINFGTGPTKAPSNSGSPAPAGIVSITADRSPGVGVAQVPPRARSQFTGLFALVADREERAACHGFALSPANQPCYTGSTERLAALRARNQVNIRGQDLPPCAWMGVGLRRWTWAVVQPDGTVTYRDDDGSHWLAENDL